jgi:hypothetical protein
MSHVSIVNMARVADGPEEAVMRHLLAIGHTETRRRDEANAGRPPLSSADFARSMADAGILIGADAPRPGRSADLPEPRGGSYRIDVASTDEALSWAAHHPGAREGTVEVRPILAWRAADNAVAFAIHEV